MSFRDNLVQYQWSIKSKPSRRIKPPIFCQANNVLVTICICISTFYIYIYRSTKIHNYKRTVVSVSYIWKKCRIKTKMSFFTTLYITLFLNYYFQIFYISFFRFYSLLVIFQILTFLNFYPLHICERFFSLQTKQIKNSSSCFTFLKEGKSKRNKILQQKIIIKLNPRK